MGERKKKQVLKKGSRSFNSENWNVFHPNGKHMFVCGERRAKWYLEKKGENGEPLAKQISEYDIKLNFTPKGDGYKKNDKFGLSPRIVRCVVTGKEDGLQRHHIVPYCYRKHFSDEYKSKNHHDVVLIRYDQHEKYEIHALQFKDKIAEMYDVKTLSEYNTDYTKLICEYTENNIACFSKLYAIFSNYKKIPQHVIKSNLESVADYYGFDKNFLFSLSYIQIYKLYTLLKNDYAGKFNRIKEKNRKKYDHGYHVVKKLNTHEKIEEFIKMWRAHFLQTMKPKYMPTGWSVNSRVKIQL